MNKQLDEHHNLWEQEVYRTLRTQWSKVGGDADKLVETIRTLNPNITDEYPKKFLSMNFDNYVKLRADLRKPKIVRINRNRLAHTLRQALVLNRRINVASPPGSWMLCVAEFLCSKKSYKQVAGPLIADMQHEYFEALSEQRVWKARWIRVRYLWSFCNVMGLVQIFKALGDVWRALTFH